jgi:hypothetical protein
VEKLSRWRAVHLNHRLLMEERSGGGRKERSELEQIPAMASRRGDGDGGKGICKREVEIYFITTYLNAGEDNIRDAEEHDGDGDDGGDEDTGRSHTATTEAKGTTSYNYEKRLYRGGASPPFPLRRARRRREGGAGGSWIWEGAQSLREEASKAVRFRRVYVTSGYRLV